MKNTARIIFLFLYLLCCVMACSKSSDEVREPENFDDPDPITTLTIESDKVTCETCDGFGKMIETYQNQVFVGGERQVWIFDYSAQGIALSQEIDFTDLGFLNSITAKDGMLYLGIFDDFGTGSVRQYAATGSQWQFTRNYDIGRDQDDFGTDIAILDTLMIIGASARWSESANLANQDEGRFYIYKTQGTAWVQTQEFQSDDPASDDRFGTDVLLTDDHILVGGLSIPMHVYKRNDTEWELASVESGIIPADMGNFGNTVLYYSEMLGLQSFVIDSEGLINSIPVTANLDLGFGIRFNADSISMTEKHALMMTLGGQKVYLLALDNDEWTLEHTYDVNLGQQFEYMAIKLHENLVLTSGTNYADNISYLFFTTYE